MLTPPHTGNRAHELKRWRPAMQTTIILTSLLGAVLATPTAYANSDVRELARTGSTITVHGYTDGR
jgi:hypothetical protein